MPGAFTRAFSSAFDIVPAQGNWHTLLGMIEEAAQIDQEDSTGTPTSCPNDHTALREGPDGKLYCPWDGLVWPDDAPAWGPYPGSY